MGYGGPEIVNELSHIFKGGGIIHMVEVVLVIGAAVSLSSIFEKTNIIAPIIDKLFRGTKSKGILTIKTGILSSLLTIITCDQSVGIILPGRLLQPIYDRMGISKYILGRTISDTGTIIAPLLPFNVNSLLITTFTGIATKEYAPYAILCYVFPIITILLGFISNKKKGDIKNEKLCDKISTSNR
jgi:NhaC family Na+:H+ antiporter